MDLDMSALLRTVAETTTAPPRPDAPSDYLHRRAGITAEALMAVAEGAHPAEVLEAMEARLEAAARPVLSDSPMVWTPTPVTA